MRRDGPLNTDLAALLDLMQLPEADQAKKNIPRRLSSIRERLLEVIQGVFRFKRVAASHVFVMMISSELRNKKPYAVPIQCLPYAGLKETNMRSMVRLVVQEMVKQGMKVAGKYVYSKTFISKGSFTVVCCIVGFVTNGEFNYMRSKGYTRPLSVLQIRTDVRNKYNRMKEDTLLQMLTPEGT